MLRFKPRPHGPLTRPTWPDYKQKEPSTAFSERPPLRRLVVVADQTLLSKANEADATQLALLAGLLSHPYIKLLRYTEGGPPVDAPRAQHERLGEIVPGWLIVGEYDERNGVWPVTFAESPGTGVTRAAIMGNSVEVAGSDDRTGTYTDLGSEAAAAQRRADAIAVRAAESAHADLFITERGFLHAVTWDLAGGVLVARPLDALPLISLYLRAQGEFITYRDSGGTSTEQMNKGLFYWVGTRELLPSGRRWFGTCVQAGQADDTLIYLGQSAFQRVQRALQARDAAHRALNQAQDNDTATEALASLDLVLLGLMAAVDVTARVAHRVLGLIGTEYDAGWQRKNWLRKVKRHSPDLAAAVAADTTGGRTLFVLSRLRNSIHGAALDALAVSQAPRRRQETMVGLPPAETHQLLRAIDLLGGRDAWGVRELLPHRAHADPGVLLDRLFIGAVNLIDELMRLTPVDRLPGADLISDVAGPPNDDGIFDTWTRQSIRWQLGL